jgi:two-component system sensor kinase ParS
MGKLFLKLFISLMVVTAAGNWVYEQVWMQALGQVGADLRKQRFGGSFYLVERALQHYPVEEWPAQFAALQPGFTVPTKLSTLDDVLVSPAFSASAGFNEAAAKRARERLRAGEILYEELETEGFVLFKRLKQSQYVMNSEFPSPPRWGLTNQILSWTTMGSLYGLAVFVWVWPFWKDLKKLIRASDEIGAGKLDTKVRLRRGSPLTPLASSFNAMTTRIAMLVESHRSLSNAVSHELRTPLARLRFGLSLAQEDPTTQGKDRYLAHMDDDVNELDSLVAEMLVYAKMERGEPSIQLQPIAVRPWLDKLLEVVQREASNAGSSVNIRTQVSVGDVCCEARYMARAVANLLRNALHYARKTVEVTVQQSANQTHIHVDDDGPGIPTAERVFEPFTRLDQSRARASGGVGLGLAIVIQVAKWHHGGVSISDSPLGGARVTISW